MIVLLLQFACFYAADRLFLSVRPCPIRAVGFLFWPAVVLARDHLFVALLFSRIYITEPPRVVASSCLLIF